MPEPLEPQTDIKVQPAAPLRPRRRGYYILPNLFTSAGLFAGFYSIVQAQNGRFEPAAIAIFVAMVCDSMDGRVARLTHTQSEFGVQYDSLSDMVSFGVAPALVMYVWALQRMGKLGWVAAFIYAVGAALRLARFNVQTAVADKRYFTGLPSPAAAALLAGLIWVMNDVRGLPGFEENWGVALSWIAWFITIMAGLTMVSNIKYYSFKTLNFRKSVPFAVVIVPVLALALLSVYPALVLFVVFVAYALSGYVLWVVRHSRRTPPPAA